MLTHCDLFSGCGGIRVGLAASYRTLAAVEADANCVATYRANHDVPVIQADIRTVTDRQLVRLMPGNGLPVDLLTAGIPCETFSSARCKPAAQDDPRRWLFRDAVRLARAVRARVILLENVPRIVTAETSPGSGQLVADEIRSALHQAGYGNQLEIVLDASDFGAATRRRRWFLAAALDPALRLRAPSPTTAGRPATVAEALGGLPDEPCGMPGRRDGVPSWHVVPRIRAATVARYSLVRSGRRVCHLLRDLEAGTAAALQRTGVLPRRGFNQRGYRLRLDRPAPTLTAHCADEWIHPRQCRPLTVRECARIQGLPDWQEFRGPLTQPHDSGRQSVYAMIGDTVPPPLARAWGDVIKEVLG